MSGIEDRSPHLRITCIVLLSSSVVTTALRCYTRAYIVRAFGLDDWLMLLATLWFGAFVGSAMAESAHGVGRHEADLSEDEITLAKKYWWLCYIWYGLTMIASKLSIGIFFLRITIRRWHRWFVYAVIFVTITLGIVFFFVSLMQCRPISYFWDKDQDGSCLDVHLIAALTYPYSALAMLCDLAYALLPIFIMHGLQMDRSTKLAIAPIMSLGCLASLAVAIRFGYIHNLADPDFLWSCISIAILSAAEQGLAITAGNLATLRPLFRTALRGMGLWSSTSVRIASNTLPPTIGAVDRNSARKSQRGPFGLATFMRDVDGATDHEDSDDGDTVKHKNGVELNSRVLRKRSSGAWCSTSKSPLNDSQEELHSKPSRETLVDARAAPKSFLPGTSGLRDSLGST